MESRWHLSLGAIGLGCFGTTKRLGLHARFALGVINVDVNRLDHYDPYGYCSLQLLERMTCIRETP